MTAGCPTPMVAFMDALQTSICPDPEMHILPRGTLRVTYLRQEPYAVVPHVRICVGVGNCHSYRDQGADNGVRMPRSDIGNSQSDGSAYLYVIKAPGGMDD